jgi:hypothetical protein
LEAKLNKLRELAMNKKFLLRVSLKKIKYNLILGKTVSVEDKTSGASVKWFQAFGNKTLNEVLRYFEIEEIILEKGEEYRFKNIDEAILFLEKK